MSGPGGLADADPRTRAVRPTGVLAELVAGTPPGRDRVVDAARATSIAVVVLWHWALAVLHRAPDDDLRMPNPVHTVPGAAEATWVLQVMPVFFLVSGYAGAAAYDAARPSGRSARAFVAAQLGRVALPVAVWAVAWLVVELALAARPGPHSFVWEWFPGYLTPLWFLGVYAVLVTLTPAVVAAHRRLGLVIVAGAAVAVAASGALARLTGERAVELAGAGLVWLAVWLLGVQWRAWRRAGAVLLPGALATVGGLLGLVLLTGWLGYPRSMVATAGDATSNLHPTTPAVAVLALFQLGLVLLATPRLDRALRRRRLWTAVLAVNGVAISLFVWHMTALLAVVLTVESLGMRLAAEPDATWWWQRPLWVLAPAAVLLPLLLLVAPAERVARRLGRGAPPPP